MISADCFDPTSATQEWIPTETQALVRIFVWESDSLAPTLARYFRDQGHPFKFRSRRELPGIVRNRIDRGETFEFFTLPIDLGALIKTLNDDEVQRDLETMFDLSELPVLLAMRKGRPADLLHPEREFQPILNLLSIWRPQSLVIPSTPSPVATDRTLCSQRINLLASLRPPFSPSFDSDDVR